MSNTVWRILASAFTVAAVAAGIIVAWNLIGPRGPIETAAEQRTYTQSPTKLVFADFEASDISVSASASSGVDIRRELRWIGDRPQHSEVWDGDTLRITHNCGDLDQDVCSIRYIIRVPSGVEVEANTTSGDVSVVGVTKDVDVDSTSGDVAVRQTSGQVQVNATSGDIKLSELTGRVSVQATSGDVTGSGLGSPEIRVKATSGDVQLVYSVAPQSISVANTSGDIGITVPRPADPYRVDVQTGSGDQRIEIDRAVTGTRSITAHATSGDVTIRYA